MFNFVWYLILIIIIVVGLNIIIDYKKYGNRIFDCFKKKDNQLDMHNLLINIFKNEIRDKVLILERNPNYFIAITKYDIFLVQLMNEKGIIIGSVKEPVFRVKKGKIKELKNYLFPFLKDSKKLLESGIDINSLIISTSKDCVLNLSDFDKKNIYSLDEFSYLLYKLQHSTFKYLDKDLDEILIKLKELLNGNN